MATVSLDPYLFFTGNCREAMAFYKEVFGGELTVMDMPDNAALVMHANLAGGVIDLMASDGTRTEPYPVSSISLSLSSADLDQLNSLFDKLSDGATAVMPLKKESWGDMFGSLTDKYGVDWMFNGGSDK